MPKRFPKGFRDVVVRVARAREPGQTIKFKDLVNRDFTAAAPNTLWRVDITEHWTGEGEPRCCATKYCFSNKIVGYFIDTRMKGRLAVAALNNAVARRAAEGVAADGCIVHADRGSQFRSRKFHRALERQGLLG